MSQPARQFAAVPAPTVTAPRRPALFADYLPAEPLRPPAPLRQRLSVALGGFAFAGLLIAGVGLLWWA